MALSIRVFWSRSCQAYQYNSDNFVQVCRLRGSPSESDSGHDPNLNVTARALNDSDVLHKKAEAVQKHDERFT